MFYDVYMQLCKNKNLSPSADAIQSGINKGTVSVWKKKWEKGIDVDPDKTTIDKLCSFFDVQETDLRGLEHIYPVLMPVAEAKIRMDDALAGIKENAPGPQAESDLERRLRVIAAKLPPDFLEREIAYLEQKVQQLHVPTDSDM